jgi:ABC-2 type transport system ATP-binding protein
VVKHFGATRALDGFDLVVEDGQLHGLLGPNGAGKTTLLRLLLGLLRPDAGDIELLGQRQGAQGAALDRVAGFVEEPAFYPYLTAADNLELLIRLDGATGDTDVDEVLSRVGLGDRRHDRVAGFSTGMRQRLGIAAALLRQPQLLLLDEPTAGLDPHGIRDVCELLRELVADGVAVLLSSHHMGEIEDICDSITIVRRGRSVWTGSLDALRRQAPASTYHLIASDNAAALECAAGLGDIEVSPSPRGGIVVSATEVMLDRYVLALGRADIAVRRLELVMSPVESMYFALTADEPDATSAQLADSVLAPR